MKTKPWRYVSKELWQMDKINPPVSPEDEWINNIEGSYDQIDTFNAHDLMAKVLTKQEYNVVDMILYDGLTFREAGLKIKRCKQRVWQIYKGALAKMAPEI